jgi:DNA-binding GntR family transcriptional regulator
MENPRPSPLNRKSGIPLYHQIQLRLLEQIRSGELKPGMPMPSIERIADRMGVSQMTVRQAVRALSELGVVYSRQGRGTFISGIKLERDFRQVLSFTEESKARGAKPSSKMLSQYGIQLMVTDEVIEVGKANAEDARLLEIAPKSPVFLFTKTSYLENGMPAEYVTSVYPGNRYKVVNRLMRSNRKLM